MGACGVLGRSSAVMRGQYVNSSSVLNLLTSSPKIFREHRNGGRGEHKGEIEGGGVEYCEKR